MEDSRYGNAMTEVALALAMAFFSIMVLTTVSMSANPETEYSRSQKNEEMEFSNTTKETIEKTNQKRKLIIFWTGQFLDKNLKAVDINEIKPDVPIVLAMSPDLKIGKVLSVRTQFHSNKTLVSTLDDAWLKRLRSNEYKGK